ncbi:glycosyltransferase [Planomonospora venezuelensis]|uniref:Glycosyltransferase involved in cell wall biosynthesis n=1 Tax=Planomonospora venezuelensis TaxID=1999 RepID=A0A841D0Y7_PLAVE|nr:glycosyltransferase [Planomonospora venezuelensis]MBB5962058.1 glycosyltransferase involved in cell wall biosynthesis [Planomonospora venezuelensis]GIN00160.1 glycosyl transferase [Planomonospora venezuelensis]
MKVLHVITGLAAGGAEQQLRTMLPHLAARCEVAVLTGAGAVAEAVEAEGIPVHRLGMRGNLDLRAVGRLTRLMRAGRYDVVHTHLYRACVYGRVAARLAGVPAIVATEHSIGEGRIEGRRAGAGVRALYRATESMGGVTVAVSRIVADRLAGWGVPRSRIEVIPNGLDGQAFRHDPRLGGRARARLGIAPGAFVVGGVGRMEAGKRFDVLLRALPGFVEAVLLLAGEGSARRELEELARTLGVAHRVVFTGESMDVPALLSAMDVLVSPSQEETFGLAVIEGLASGLPVFYAACPALDELPPDAAPGARRILPDPDHLRTELRTLAATGPLRLPPPRAVAYYDIRRHAARTEALYERLLGRTAPVSGRHARQKEFR